MFPNSPQTVKQNIPTTQTRKPKNPENTGATDEKLLSTKQNDACTQYKVSEYLYQNPPPEGVDIPLSLISARDSVWNVHRVDTYYVQHLYGLNSEYERYSERLSGCSGFLQFGFSEQSGMVLKHAVFCRVRYCPVCQWRKSLLWKALMYNSFDEVRKEYPTHRFVFLTLTVANPLITDLRETLKHMNKSWKRLTDRKEFMRVVDGWIRTTEVTRPKGETANTHAHPHFHCVLMVKPSYFSKGYIKQSRWVELWADVLRADYLPNVDVRAVKTKRKGGNYEEAMKATIAETLKYAVKPSDIVRDMQNPKSRDWFYELTEQTRNMRFVATGGALKNALKQDKEITNDDMVNTGNSDENTETDDRRLNFTFYPSKEKYLYNPTYNQ